MEIKFRAVGIEFDDLIDDVLRDLRSANRAVGRKVATAGKRAIASGAPRMFGKKLSVKTEVRPRTDGCQVGFAGRPSGGWAIQEAGANPHLIVPRRRKALTIEGRFAMRANHPGTSGHQAWSKAKVRLQAAIEPVVQDVYGDALGT
jgi:hypothetical protein